MTETVRLGIVGVGYGARVHLPVFAAQAGVEVVGICGSGPGAISAQTFPDAPSFEGPEALLDTRPDAVVVATPPQCHHDLVIAAISRGCAVLCEKPFGLHAGQAEAMCQATAGGTLPVLAVGYQFRYEPGLRQLKDAVVTGSLGQIRHIDIDWQTAGRGQGPGLYTWRNDRIRGGGVLLAFVSHVVDLLLWLTGGTCRQVFAHSAIHHAQRADDQQRMHTVTAEDAVVASLDLDGGVAAQCRVSNGQPGGDGMRVTIVGSQAVARFHHRPPFTPADQSLVLHTAAGSLPHDLTQIPAIESGLDTRCAALQGLASDFISACRGGPHGMLPGAGHAWRVQTVLDALRESCDHSRAVEVRSA